MLLYILAALALLVLALFVIAALRPKDFRVTRRTVIGAPPATVFKQVNTLRDWEAWSPWQKLDPNMQQSYDGPAAGVGAVSAWTGNNKVGAGRMTITESRAAELIRFKLEFLKPFTATNAAEFTFSPAGQGTAISWSMDGKNSLICRVMGLFMNMDKMVGDQFEQGLANLKQVAESGAAR